MTKVYPPKVAQHLNAKAFRALEAANNDRNEAERARESVLELMAEAKGIGCIRATAAILADLNRQLTAANNRAFKASRRLRRTADMTVAPYDGKAKPAIERLFRDLVADFGIPAIIDTGAAQ